jgi:hypothetical protein
MEMDWSYQWQGIVEGMSTPSGWLSVFMLPLIFAAGATAAHQHLRRSARTVWSPVGVALLPCAAIWVLSALTLSCVYIENWLRDSAFAGVIAIVAAFVLPLAAVVLAIKRGYDCTCNETTRGTILFAITVAGAGFVAALFLPNY